MTFLRLSTTCAVIADDGSILLSKRGDLNIWNLPGGRLDAHEPIAAAAAREVREETGAIVHIDRMVGLYYWQGWARLMVAHTGFMVGGEVFQKSDETRENRFFAPDSLPDANLHTLPIQHALSDAPPQLSVIVTPLRNLRRIKWRLRRRYVANLLRGRPEPRFVRFKVSAAAVIYDLTGERLLTLPYDRIRTLPRMPISGDSPPWQQLTRYCRREIGLLLDWKWCGLWQNTATNEIELVFTTSIDEATTTNGQVEWSPRQNAPLGQRDADYVHRTSTQNYPSVIWTTHPEGADTPFDTLDV